MFNHTGNGTVSSSTSSSRNNSPRPHNEMTTATGAAAAKLRSGITNRNLNLQQRNSVNYTSSTLQEDLMKLINPDYMTASSDDNFHPGGLQNTKPQKNTQNSHSLGNISALGGSGLKVAPNIITDDVFLMRKKSRSREAINLGSHGLPITSGNGIADKMIDSNHIAKSESEIIFTTARPATIISTYNSVADGTNGTEKNNNNILHIKEDHLRMSPRKSYANHSGNVKRQSADSTNLMQQPLPLLPDSKEVDWTTLVDRAIMQVNEGLKHSQSKHNFYEEIGAHGIGGNNNNNNNLPPINGSSSSNDSCSSEISTSLSPSSSSGGSSSNNDCVGDQLSMVVPSASLPDLQNQVSQLEDRITKETRRRKSLEHAVRKLSEENRRLQDESQAAVQQLRRFTEWFFQTIDRQ